MLGYVMVCKTITVRFLPVNKFGNSSQFSESVSLSVYGGMIYDKTDLVT